MNHHLRGDVQHGPGGFNHKSLISVNGARLSTSRRHLGMLLPVEKVGQGSTGCHLEKLKVNKVLSSIRVGGH